MKEIKLDIMPVDGRTPGKASLRNNLKGFCSIGSLRVKEVNEYIMITADGPKGAKDLATLTIPDEYLDELIESLQALKQYRGTP